MSAPSRLVQPRRWSHHQVASRDGVEQARTSLDHSNTEMIPSPRTERVRYADFPLGVKSYAKELCTFCEELLRHNLEHEGVLSFTCGHFAHEQCLIEFLAEFITDHCCPACSLPLEVDSSHRSQLGEGKQLPSHSQHSFRVFANRVHDETDSPVNALRRRPGEKNKQSQYTNLQISSPNATTPPRSPQTPTPQYRHYTSETLNVLSQSARKHEAPDDYLEPLDGRKQIKGHTTKDNDDATSTTTTPYRQAPIRNPIPAPTVHIKSEYPNLVRSDEARALICLVTVEVPTGRWMPSKDELGHLRRIPETRSMQSNHSDSNEESSDEEVDDAAQDLEREASNLKNRVDNWHGLPFTK